MIVPDYASLTLKIYLGNGNNISFYKRSVKTNVKNFFKYYTNVYIFYFLLFNFRGYIIKRFIDFLR